MRRNWAQTTGGILGSGLVLAMLFANQLGLDNNPVWGAKRFIFFFIGILILAASLLYRENNFIGQAFNTYTGQLYLAIGVLSASTIVIYIWVVSIGLWTTWPNETSYYDLLATAFSHGQISLEVQPDPALFTLENLYEPGSREGIPVLWDASLYKGKYYLYWGPTPAMLLALIKPFYTQPIGDKIPTFVFVTGTFIFITMLILELWKKYYLETPRWAILLGIAFAGLVNPMLYILIEARIYEAAIISGQFFLIGGLYWLFTAFNHPSTTRLSLAGLFFALAIGSRTTLALPIAFLALITLIWAIKSQRERVFALITAFALLLILGTVSYGWYNQARFDSITEFGLRYQLTSYNLYETLDETFSLEYIPPNTYKTLFNTLERRITFPFLFPTRWAGPSWLEGSYPNFYLLLAEGITGILVGSPFMIFAFLAGLNKNKTFRWILTCLAGASLLTFFTLQIFFFTTMRYLLDLIPALSLLAVIGFWQGLTELKTRPIAWRLFTTLGVVLCIYSIAISLLLPISGHLEAYRVFNPELLRKMTLTFNSLVNK